MGYRTCASESNRHGRCRSSQVEGGLFWKSGQNVGSRGGPKGKGERERRRKRGGCTAKRGNETPSPDSENSRSYRAAERIILSLLRVTDDYRLVVIQSYYYFTQIKQQDVNSTQRFLRRMYVWTSRRWWISSTRTI